MPGCVVCVCVCGGGGVESKNIRKKIEIIIDLCKDSVHSAQKECFACIKYFEER